MILRPCTPKFIWNPWKASPNQPIFRQTHGQGEVDERGPSYQGGETWLTFGNVTNHGTWQCFVGIWMCLIYKWIDAGHFPCTTHHVMWFSRALHHFFCEPIDDLIHVFWWILVVQELPQTCISCGLVGKKDHFVIVVAPLWAAIFLWDPHHFPRENLGLKHMKFHMTVARLHNMDWWRMRFIIWG